MKPASAPWTCSAPVAWDVVCPQCGEGIGNPGNGSHHWMQEDFDAQGDTLIQCVGCELVVRVKAPRKHIKP